VTSDLHSARQRWLTEKARYAALSDCVVDILKAECKRAGLFAWITGRSKDTASLLKKLAKKEANYEDLTDKAGARVVVRFREGLTLAEAVVEQSFKVIRREDKTEKLGHNRVGYQAIHYDTVLRNFHSNQSSAAQFGHTVLIATLSSKGLSSGASLRTRSEGGLNFFPAAPSR